MKGLVGKWPSQSIDDNGDGIQMTALLRGCDCRDCCCSKCGGGRAGDRARDVARVVATFKKIMFWTFTIDATAYGGHAREIFLHLLRVRAISEAMRVLRKGGYAGRWVAVIEFHKSGFIHVHLIVEALQKKIPHAIVHAAWNQQRHRPEWAGEVQKYEDGKRVGQYRPAVGYVQYEKLKKEKGELHSNAVARYVCGYLSKGAKHGEPGWARSYRNGDVDGKRHNNLLFKPSRDFWRGFRDKRPTSNAVSERPAYKFKRVEERHASCRKSADVLCRAEVLSKGEVIDTKYVYLGKLGGELGYTGALAVARPAAEVFVREPRGAWLSDETAGYFLTDTSPFWNELKGPFRKEFERAKRFMNVRRGEPAFATLGQEFFESFCRDFVTDHIGKRRSRATKDGEDGEGKPV